MLIDAFLPLHQTIQAATGGEYRFVAKWGRPDLAREGNVKNLTGIAVDTAGLVYAADRREQSRTEISLIGRIHTGLGVQRLRDGQRLAAYAGGSGYGVYTGIFPRIEKNGWTGIAFVNTEGGDASVMLTAYNDNGAVVATWVLALGGYAKVVNFAEKIFPLNIGSATYIVYTSDRNVIGFQLNGSADGTMLDGLVSGRGSRG